MDELINAILDKIIEAAADLEDGETGLHYCIEEYCEKMGYPDEMCEAAQDRAFFQAAVDA